MERLIFSDAGPADWPYLLCLWWRNVRVTHGFVAEDYLRAIGAALPGAYLPAMERVRLAWLAAVPHEGPGDERAPGARHEGPLSGTVAVPSPTGGRWLAGFLGSVGQQVEMLFVEPGLRGRGIGTALLEDFASRHPGILLDVNEQNTAARDFYARRGFEVAGRSPLDGAGQPYPLLHLRRLRARDAGTGRTA
ncbi:GNAT family N-acetyltransferase [Desulfovibrio piger]|uniref:GNAT family N-acetyltransferase n=1 Tax=Desulfovibrio piger TaxID=901 RepID=UPI0039F6215C